MGSREPCLLSIGYDGVAIAAACERHVGAMVSRHVPIHDERGIEASGKLGAAGSKTTGGAGVKPVPPVVPRRVNYSVRATSVTSKTSN
uniref:Uncharacterized protein n=1 Tax=Paraburkholderia sprentiae WSM5005 TaxID=754502 RepID=A0A1I9YFP9_9BURK